MFNNLKNRLDWPTFILGIAWYAFVSGLIWADVGEMTSGPILITWWDAIWIPFIFALFPFLLGMSAKSKR